MVEEHAVLYNYLRICFVVFNEDIDRFEETELEGSEHGICQLVHFLLLVPFVVDL